ncbi:MAG: hypothetical protein RLZZ378_870 [Actinomycetota bacterium]
MRVFSATKILYRLLLLETLIAIIWTVYLALTPLFSEVTSPLGLVLDILYYVIFSSALWVCARGISRGKRYAQAPTLLINLILLGVAYYMVVEKVLWYSIPIGYFFGLLAILILICVFIVFAKSNKSKSI